MAKEFPKQNPVSFPDGTPVHVTFDFDVASSKSFTKDSEYSESGKVTKFIVSVNDKKDVIFASEALFKKIQEFKKGESATITFAEKRWIVQAAGEKKTSEIDKWVEATEQTILIRSIYKDLQAIKKHILGDKDESTDEIKISF